MRTASGVVEEVLDTHGQLDILVNNAGITGARRFGR
jgi:NAD(P)-dependent dehydrogenase (short-subunit alcohol dehydrogenase family)